MARLIIVEDNHELANLIASAARSRGHTALAVHTGQMALDALEFRSYDAAIVDLLLPDMRGSDVLDVLARRKVPAFAMSGVYRGERFAREATEQHGAREFFEKPFSLRTVLDAVDQALGVTTAEGLGVEELDALEELSPIEDLEDAAHLLPGPGKVVDVQPPPPPPDAILADTPAADALPVLDLLPDDEITRPAGNLEALLAQVKALPPVPPVPEEASDEASEGADASPGQERTEPEGHAAPSDASAQPGRDLTESKAQARATELHDDEVTRPAGQLSALLAKAERENALPFTQRGKVWNEAAGAKPVAPEKRAASAPQPETAGSIAQSPVPRLLTAYFQARHSGELRLKQDTVQKVVEFENGVPVYAASNIATERFGRFCAKKGAIPESELPRVAAYSRDQQLRTGVAMERLGLITGEQRVKLLEEQVREIIWSTFPWTRGDYQFAPRSQRRADLVKLAVFPGNLILEGILRTATLATVRQKMTAQRRLLPNADPPYALHELALTAAQAMLLVHTDGSKSVEDLLTLTDLSERDALAALWAFELLGLIVERREEPKRPRISFGL